MIQVVFNGVPTSYERDFSINEKLSFDDDLCMFFVESEEDISLGKEAYDIVQEDLLSNNQCATYPIKINCNGNIIFDGICRLIDSGVRPQTCTVDTKIVFDNDYLAISELSGSEIFSTERKVRNNDCCDETEILPAIRYQLVEGTCDDNLRNVVRIVDAMEHWIRWAELDYQLGYVNPFIESLYIAKPEMMQGQNIPLEYSFEDLVELIKSQIPVIIELKDGMLNVYSYDEYFENDSQTLPVSDFKIVAVNVNKDKSYSGIKLGGNITLEEDTLTNCGNTRPVVATEFDVNGWGDYTLNKDGCVNSEIFDLSSNYVRDHNSIKNLLSREDVNGDFVLMYLEQFVDVDGFTKVRFPEGEFYNEQLNNRNLIERYAGFLSVAGLCVDDFADVAWGYMRQVSLVEMRIPIVPITTSGGFIFTEFPSFGWLSTVRPSRAVPVLSNNGLLRYEELAPDRDYLIFTPTETGCYCITKEAFIYAFFSFGDDTPFAPELKIISAVLTADAAPPPTNYNRFEIGALNPFIVGQDEIDVTQMAAEQGVLDSVISDNNNMFYENVEVVSDFCVELEAGQDYIIDQTWLTLNPSPETDDYGRFSVQFSRSVSLSIKKCDSIIECSPNLELSVEGKICLSDWQNLDRRKLIEFTHCGNTYRGNISEIDRNIKTGIFTGKLNGEIL